MAFTAAGALLLGAAWTGAARESGDRSDLSRMSCADFRSLSADEQHDAIAWLQGYRKGAVEPRNIGRAEFDLDASDFDKVCDKDSGALRNETRFNAHGQVRLEPGQITCREFTNLDGNVQRELMAFADGYAVRKQSQNASNGLGDYQSDARSMLGECRRDPSASFWSVLESSSSGDRLNRDRYGDRDTRDRGRGGFGRRDHGDLGNVSDMTNMSCDQFRSLNADDQGKALAWLDGYGRRGRDVGAAEFDRNTDQMAQICENRPNAPLSGRLRNLPNGRKQVMPDRMSCQEFGNLDRNVQEELVAFADGYQARNRSSSPARRDEDLRVDRRDVAQIRQACRQEPNVSFWEKTDLLSPGANRYSRD